MAWNGFYHTKNIKNLKSFYLRAVILSYRFHIDYLPGVAREIDKTMSLHEMLKLVSSSTHNVCIDREVYGGETFSKEHDDVGEVGFATLGNKSKYIFIYLNRENFDKLVKEFKLEKR